MLQQSRTAIPGRTRAPGIDVLFRCRGNGDDGGGGEFKAIGEFAKGRIDRFEGGAVPPRQIQHVEGEHDVADTGRACARRILARLSGDAIVHVDDKHQDVGGLSMIGDEVAGGGFGYQNAGGGVTSNARDQFRRSNAGRAADADSHEPQWALAGRWSTLHPE